MIDITQPTDYSCFATSVAMITGIDVDLFRLDWYSAPYVFRSANRESMTLIPWESWDDIPNGAVTILEWTELLDSLGYESTIMDDVFVGLEGVLGFTLITGPGKSQSHAVAVDNLGVVHCPSNCYTGFTVQELAAAENILFGGYVVIKEKDNG
jgi:hypothetical protein